MPFNLNSNANKSMPYHTFEFLRYQWQTCCSDEHKMNTSHKVITKVFESFET